jgi:hypothetical protein
LSALVIAVHSNNILVTFPSEADVARSAAAVQTALLAALSAESVWLLTSTESLATYADANVSKESMEAVIESAVGPLLASHGGSIEVLSVVSRESLRTDRCVLLDSYRIHAFLSPKPKAPFTLGCQCVVIRLNDRFSQRT